MLRLELAGLGEEARPPEPIHPPRRRGEGAEEVVVVTGDEELRTKAASEVGEVVRCPVPQGQAGDESVDRRLVLETLLVEPGAPLDVEAPAARLQAPAEALR